MDYTTTTPNYAPDFSILIHTGVIFSPGYEIPEHAANFDILYDHLC